MALSIRSPLVEQLARSLSEQTGKDMTQTIQIALEQMQTEYTKTIAPLRQQLIDIARRCADLPILDQRTPDQILGYTDDGTF